MTSRKSNNAASNNNSSSDNTRTTFTGLIVFVIDGKDVVSDFPIKTEKIDNPNAANLATALLLDEVKRRYPLAKEKQKTDDKFVEEPLHEFDDRGISFHASVPIAHNQCKTCGSIKGRKTCPTCGRNPWKTFKRNPATKVADAAPSAEKDK